MGRQEEHPWVGAFGNCLYGGILYARTCHFMYNAISQTQNIFTYTVSPTMRRTLEVLAPSAYLITFSTRPKHVEDTCFTRRSLCHSIQHPSKPQNRALEVYSTRTDKGENESPSGDPKKRSKHHLFGSPEGTRL